MPLELQGKWDLRVLAEADRVVFEGHLAAQAITARMTMTAPEARAVAMLLMNAANLIETGEKT